MLHIIEVTPKAKEAAKDAISRSHAGRPYIAGVTKHYYLAKLVKAEIERQVSYLTVRIADSKPGLNFPMFIYELGNDFTYHPATKKMSPLLRKKKGTLYRLTGDWFPTQIGADLMGVLDHIHLDEDEELEIDAFKY